MFGTVARKQIVIDLGANCTEKKSAPVTISAALTVRIALIFANLTSPIESCPLH